MQQTTTKKFELGKLYLSRCVNDKCADDLEFCKFLLNSLKRHAIGDWGDLPYEDRKENDYSLDKYLRIFSAYDLNKSVKVWIITEADRSVTTILFPDEY